MKNKKIKIALLQSAVSDNLKKNIKKSYRQAEQAARQGAKIICLQELYKTPYFPQAQQVDVEPFLEAIPGESTDLFAKLAKKYRCSIILPIYEKANDGKLYNTAVVLNEKGRIQKPYRKMHIPQDPGFYEKNYFEKGNYGYQIYKQGNVKFAVLICFDQWFPEAARMVRLEGAEIVFYPTAIGYIKGYKAPEGDWHKAWELVQRGHAVANSMVVAAINRTGNEGEMKFWGQSFIADSFGKLVARASKTKEQVLVAEVDLGLNKFISDGWGFIHNRRVDSYKLNTNKLIYDQKKLRKSDSFSDSIKALNKKKSK